MVTAEIKNSLKQTLSELNYVENELNRPVEDVVTLSICLTSRKSINNLMRAFLNSSNINPNKESSLHDLLEECKKVDPQFSAIDMSKIFCTGHSHSQCEDKHCLSYNNVEECASVAKTVKELVLNKLQLNESELV